jgi:hypothetical protein
MKHCARCGKTKPRSEFFSNRARHDGLSGYCRPCQTAYNNAAQVAVRVQCFDLLGRCCVTCGFSDDRALTFDHIHGGGCQDRKSMGGPVSWYRDVLAHPEKYQVLCWNCQHIKRIETGEHGGRRALPVVV